MDIHGPDRPSVKCAGKETVDFEIASLDLDLLVDVKGSRPVEAVGTLCPGWADASAFPRTPAGWQSPPPCIDLFLCVLLIFNETVFLSHSMGNSFGNDQLFSHIDPVSKNVIVLA